MILIDMPMPDRCLNCPLLYWIRTGEHAGLAMCNAIEARDGGFVPDRCLIDELCRRRPEKCPIMKEI